MNFRDLIEAIQEPDARAETSLQRQANAENWDRRRLKRELRRLKAPTARREYHKGQKP